MSLPSTSPVPTQVTHKHDGHVEGFLNCIALRHGWTRTFSLSPAEVNALDYSVLEKILELATLKLRSINLRIYVENPAGSGIYSKVRFWKDDGSLQSVLVKEFFESRRLEGGLLRFEIRDGRQRAGGVWEEDTTAAAESVGSEAPSPVFNKAKKKSSISLDWFSKKGREAPHGEDKSPSRAHRFLYFFLSVTKGPTVTASPEEVTPVEPHQSGEGGNAIGHEDEEQERLLRRKSPLRTRLAHSSSPFFSSSTTRTSARPRPERLQAVRFQSSGGEASAHHGPSPNGHRPEDDGESVGEAVDMDDLQEPVQPVKQSNNPLDRLRPFLTKAASSASVPRKLKRRPAQKDNAPSRDDNAHFRGADVVRRPEDAFPPRAPSPMSEVPHAGGSSSAQELDNLLDEGDDDPFRG